MRAILKTTFVRLIRTGVRGLRVVITVLEAVGSLEAGDWGGWGQLRGGVEDLQELLVDLVVRRAGAVLVPLLVPHVHGLDVEVARPLLAGTTAG